VAEGDGAAAHVDLLRVEAAQLRARHRDDRERLVDLVEVDLVLLQPQLLGDVSVDGLGRGRREPLGRLRRAAVADDAPSGSSLCSFTAFSLRGRARSRRR
jgi:hypothetical protein